MNDLVFQLASCWKRTRRKITDVSRETPDITTKKTYLYDAFRTTCPRISSLHIDRALAETPV